MANQTEVKTSNDPERIDPATGEYRVIAPGQTFRSITEKIARIVLTPHTPMGWFGLFAVAGGGATMLLVALTWLFLKGVGIWAITQPVAWGFAIINFVWWIGIGHAGTLISAILLLFKQGWRNSISRFAEAMTIFAVMCAGMFPLIHVGRPWLGYWMLPAALHHDGVAAVPLAADVGRLRGLDLRHHLGGLLVHRHGSRFRHLARSLAIEDRAVFLRHAVAWAGAARCATGCAMRRPRCCWPAWPRRWCSRVHTVISFDFAVAVLPGWHTTIFPPYFVAGAIYSGFAMVLTLAIPLRKFYHLEALVTERHIDNMGKVMLVTGFIVAYGYGMEAFMAWYSADHWEAFTFWNRAFGPMGWSYWVLITCNLAIPLTTLWSRKLRTNIAFMFFISIVVNTGMWFERFVIIVTSLTRDFLPSAWGTYRATKWDYMTFVGTLGFFVFMFLLFVRFLPMIPMNEIRMLLPGAKIKPKACGGW